MKKRILTMVLALTMIMGILTGCGAGGSKEITVSEMLNSIIEEEGEVVIYTMYKDGNKATMDYVPKASTKNTLNYIYTGDACYPERPSHFTTLEEFLLGNAKVEADKNTYGVDNPHFKWETDDDGNVTLESLNYGKNDDESHDIHFGSFSREEIAGKSCMMFKHYVYKNNSNDIARVYVTIIEDTDYTKNKTVVLDPVDSVK